MLDNYLSKTISLKMIKEIRNNERYFKKKCDFSTDHFISIDNEAALYIFYDALYKYKVIIDDESLFDYYIDQIEKLYRKLDNFSSIKYGINKLICSILMTKFNIKDIKTKEARETIIKHVYNKYIKDGYFIHGFNSAYLDNVKKDGFIPEVYENYYDDFNNINSIFEKYNCSSVINKDFKIKNVYFTDDLVMGCYYSNYSPLFYYKFLFNEELFGKRIRKDNCLKCDSDELSRHLKRFMNNNSFNDKDKKYILDIVDNQYNLIHRNKNKISLLLVKRSIVFSKDAREEDFLKDSSDIYEIIDRMLSPKYNNLEHNEFISKDDFKILELNPYYDLEEEKKIIKKEEEKLRKKEKELNDEFINKYGNVSLFILLGAIFISLGVILMIINVLRG
ncbi:MAG: hypothetical protein IK137_04325 [Bacilli bacterium]|nr:hypothetical protein [Bacilli bacterium]